MKENLGFYLALVNLILFVLTALRSLFEEMPKDVLITIFLFSFAVFLIVQIFYHETKGCAPYNLRFIKIPPWVVPSCICVALTAFSLLFL